MEKFSDKRYEELKEKARTKFLSFKPVHCPALNLDVHFVSEGFDHIIHKNKSRPRRKEDQFARFQIIDLAREVIQKSSTIQEIEDIPQEVIVKNRKKKERQMKLVTYWGFIAIISKMKIKVIVKKMGKGQAVFWSVIPFWRTTRHGDNYFRDYTSGNLQED